jgi:hypothetical protein
MVINDVDKFGCAPESYEKPVLLSREQYQTLRQIDRSEEIDMEDVHAVCGACNDLGVPRIGQWVLENQEKYLSGINGAGFEVRRYQIKLDYPDNTDIKLSETEIMTEATEYINELKQSYTQRKYILRNREDKGVDIRRLVRNPTTGDMEERTLCILRLKAISPRKRAGTQQLRFPMESQEKRES